MNRLRKWIRAFKVRRPIRTSLALSVALAGISAQRVAHAESLSEAISLAYKTNPVLKAARADLRQRDEQYVQARAALGPTGQFSEERTSNDSQIRQQSLFGGNNTTRSSVQTDSTQISINQPLYTGGALSLRLSESQANILGAREALRQQEAGVLTEVIGAYVDVLLAQNLSKIAAQNIEILQQQSAEIKAKFRVKEVTQTDNAQTKVRLISAQANLMLAEQKLSASRAKYLSIIGQSPGDLDPPLDLPGLPPTLTAAFEFAAANNPELKSAQYRERASRTIVAEERAADGLQIGLNFSVSRGALAPYLDKTDNRSLSTILVVKKPLFTSGLHASRVRSALEGNDRDRWLAADAERRINFSVSQCWGNLATARRLILALQEQLTEAKKAFKGAKIEELNGLRSTIDVLNAEQEYQNTKEALVQQYHDEYLARVNLLVAMGALQTELIEPGVETYHPEDSLAQIVRKHALPWAGLVKSLDKFGAPAVPMKTVPRDQLDATRQISPAADMPDTPAWRDLLNRLNED